MDVQRSCIVSYFSHECVFVQDYSYGVLLGGPSSLRSSTITLLILVNKSGIFCLKL